MTPVVAGKKLSKFDPKTFLSTIDGGRKIAAFLKKQTIFVQGQSSDAVFYIQNGKGAMITMVGPRWLSFLTSKCAWLNYRSMRRRRTEKSRRSSRSRWAP